MHMVGHRGIRDLRHLVSLPVVSNICSMSGDKRHLLFSLQGKIYQEITAFSIVSTKIYRSEKAHGK